MAENENGQDKTEDPTEKKVKDSRAEGQIARSKELTTLVVMLMGAGGLLMFGAGIAQMMSELMRDNFTISRETIMDQSYMGKALLSSGLHALVVMLPFLIAMLAAALVGPILLGGWLFSTKSLMPKFSRMNPAAGLKRMFSPHALVELLKSFGKFLIILAVALVVLSKERNDLVAIAHEPLEQAMIHSLLVVGWSSFWMACGLMFIAAADVHFVLYEAHKKLLMTKQEVRDEHKNSEGSPEVKQRIRQLQREMSQRRMMASIPEADVIITNPTHFAVALKYDPEQGGAPMLLAKGTDLVALKIREIGAHNQILILESAALARSIYYSTELDQEIPAGLYLAVAQVLAYVYQIRQFHSGQGKRPDPLGDVKIPPDLQRDA
ncbi:flagellar biosynthesis protein FlhB [Pseudomonas syringae pv. actinidiae ICMP 19071]|uniref:flagellar biosynthesis protein FlhB n=1 Tax=Pseudomonas syringae TaxID=317 RepID=UPI000357FA3F|nr:flagellar biosynthesis protein FlhB [Pseudomonas syringae]EPM56348.1 flagellar biosynthesis protein FlhB [Pseudomonas syringae pv. actinidiae ICMP 19073]EPM60228.1 flagellar biosynthesis protein FlhB [Pseudomonas syringae pv. actinidiae ICMP 19071]EPM77993.1 flagellar biosynthesis protein FlhB [Pseudomonas syringae pv. actinidiae ICMP 19072]OSN65239.1 Flagellar biosynthetic protein FlhB [Pseudomonas syringae pv. actinidiae]OSN76296.1 Flagellar biosynthetic protein FlhB [Pseudomonas syringae